MAPMTPSATSLGLADDEAVTFASAVVEHEPDADVPDGDLAWWLAAPGAGGDARRARRRRPAVADRRPRGA